MRILYTSVLFLLLPSVALAAPQTFDELVDLVITLINGGIGVALILGIVVYFYGVATSIPKLGEGDMDRLRAHFVWGLLALFVMFSVWGILALVRNTLFDGDGYSEIGNEGGGGGCLSIEDCVIGQ